MHQHKSKLVWGCHYGLSKTKSTMADFVHFWLKISSKNASVADWFIAIHQNTPSIGHQHKSKLVLGYDTILAKPWLLFPSHMPKSLYSILLVMLISIISSNKMDLESSSIWNEFLVQWYNFERVPGNLIMKNWNEFLRMTTALYCTLVYRTEPYCTVQLLLFLIHTS